MSRIASLALASMLAGGCSSGTPSSPSSVPGATTAPASTGAPSAPPMPSAEPVPPMQRYPADDAPINIVGLGGYVWASGDGHLLRIDVDTGATRTFPTPVEAGSGSLGAFGDAVWLADWRGGMVYRIDPGSGAITGSVAVDKPVGVVATEATIWVGSEGASGLTRIDSERLEVAGSIDVRGNFAVAADSVWFAQRTENRLLRVDPATAAVQATLTFPPEAQPAANAGRGSCFVGGAMPRAWWTWCFMERGGSTAMRIDVDADGISEWVPLGGSVSGGVLVIDGLSWFVLTEALVAVDDTNLITRVVSLGEGFDANTAIAFAGALWIPNEGGREVVRIDLAALR